MAVGSLDRNMEEVFKATNKVDGIQNLNNFLFNSDGSVLARRQYNIGNGKVNPKQSKPKMTNMCYRHSKLTQLTVQVPI